MEKPLVSIIVANWNGGKVFADCLASISKLQYPNWELIIVDNGSTDGSDRLANNAIVIKNKENLGFARANNQGYEKAKGKYLLFLNNDTKVSSDLLDKLVEKMQNDLKVGVLQPKIKIMDKPEYLDNAGSFFTWSGFLKHWGFGQKDGSEFDDEKEIFSAKGACMLVRREVVEKVGLFDPDFVSYFEESDFCWRVWLAGYRVLFYPRTYIYHKVGFTIKRLDVANINFRYYKNRITSLIKNLGTERLVIILPIHLALSVGIFLAFLLRGNKASAGMILKAIFWNITNFGKTLTKRKSVQKLRRVSDDVLFSNLSRPVNFLEFFQDFKRVEKDITVSKST